MAWGLQIPVCVSTCPSWPRGLQQGGAGHGSPDADGFAESAWGCRAVHLSGQTVSSCAPAGLSLGAHVWTEGGFHSVAWLVSFVIVCCFALKKMFCALPGPRRKQLKVSLQQKTKAECSMEQPAGCGLGGGGNGAGEGREALSALSVYAGPEC